MRFWADLLRRWTQQPPPNDTTFTLMAIAVSLGVMLVSAAVMRIVE